MYPDIMKDLITLSVQCGDELEAVSGDSVWTSELKTRQVDRDRMANRWRNVWRSNDKGLHRTARQPLQLPCRYRLHMIKHRASERAALMARQIHRTAVICVAGASLNLAVTVTSAAQALMCRMWRRGMLG